MRKTALSAFVFCLLFTGESCIKNKSCTAKTVQSEQSAIVNYAAANGISATAHSSGLYYQVLIPGSGPVPTSTSTVSVRYTGKLLNGTVFDSQTGTPSSFQLNTVIQGWQIGLPLLHKGGSIILLIPSSLAYGCTGFGAVPPDSILYFEIDLVDVI